MDYLRGNATASATGLFVICRYLSSLDRAQTEEELRQSLEVLRSLNSSPDESSAVLKASLAVGEGLGLLTREASNLAFTADKDIVTQLTVGEDSWPWFRGELLHRIGLNALSTVEADKKAPDLALGMAWFMQLSPLRPPNTSWGSGPEELVRSIEFDAVSRSEQWRPFKRWAAATGLARLCDHRGAKVLVPDASTAIADQISSLPTAASARDWLAALQVRLPIFGSQVLLSLLPQGGTEWLSLPPGVVLGLLKLEQKQVLSLAPSDDATDVVALGFGTATRQVGRITVGSKK